MRLDGAVQCGWVVTSYATHHAWQEGASVVSEKWPGAHSVHTPPMPVYQPGMQSTQMLSPPKDCLPAAQL